MTQLGAGKLVVATDGSLPGLGPVSIKRRGAELTGGGAASDLGEVHVTQLLLLELAGHDLLVDDGLEVLGVTVAPVLLPPDGAELASQHEAGLPGGLELVLVHVICGQTFFDFVELLQDLLFFHIQLLKRIWIRILYEEILHLKASYLALFELLPDLVELEGVVGHPVHPLLDPFLSEQGDV